MWTRPERIAGIPIPDPASDPVFYRFSVLMMKSLHLLKSISKVLEVSLSNLIGADTVKCSCMLFGRITSPYSSHMRQRREKEQCWCFMTVLYTVGVTRLMLTRNKEIFCKYHGSGCYSTSCKLFNNSFVLCITFD